MIARMLATTAATLSAIAALSVSSSIAHASAPSSQTILIGGGPQICSSLNRDFCDLNRVDRLARANSKQHRLFQFSAKTSKQIAQASWLSPEQQMAAAELFAQIKPQQQLEQAEVIEAVNGSIKGQQWLQTLSPRQQWLMLDLLEQPQTDRYGERLKEQVWLDANKNQHTNAILASIRSSAIAATSANGVSESTEPRTDNETSDSASILFMTSSARDPFAQVDRYQHSFGEQANWLPIDASMQQARLLGECHRLEQHRIAIQGNLNRAKIYPKLTAQQKNHCLKPQLSVELINQAQLLFINDGDQALAWHALRHPDGSATPELTAILNRWLQGKLIIAASGASAVAQSSTKAPMVVSGANRSSLTEGFQQCRPLKPDGQATDKKSCLGSEPNEALFQPLGGIGTFVYGVVDSHVSEHSRQLRLSALNQTIDGEPWLMGIDTNTAAMLRDDHLTVVGENGVWLAQGSGQRRLLTHYLQQGDQASLENGAVTLAKPQYDQRNNADTPALATMKSENDDYRQLTQSLCASTANQALGHIAINGRHFGVLLNTTPHSQFSQLPDHKWCSYRGVELQYGEIKDKQE